jgi:hypothetical protein
VLDFRHFAKNTLENEYSINILLFWRKYNSQKLKNFFKIAKFCHNYLQHERVIKIFLYFEYRQICPKYSYG